MKSPFDVWIEPRTWERLNQYATTALPTEIGGLAKLRVEGETVFIEDFQMIEQEASSVTFSITQEDIQKFTLGLVQQDREDEMSQWCSIVHSHPVGMGASMSSVDVDAIKRFAEDQDAFSLIISASANADSTTMLMHYCTTIRGRQVIFHDMPVQVGYNINRINQGKELAGTLAKHFGVEDSKFDMDKLNSSCVKFMAEMVPNYFNAEKNQMIKDVREDVAKIIKKRPVTSLVKNTGGWYSSGGAGYVSGGWTEQDEKDWMDFEKGFDPGVYQHGPAATGPKDAMKHQLSNIVKLRLVADDMNAPKTRRKKARKSYERAVTRFNDTLRKEGGIGLGDCVYLNQDQVQKTVYNSHLFDGFHLVQDVHLSHNTTFYVDDEAFFPEELVLAQTFEEQLEATRLANIAAHAPEEIA